MNTTDTPDAGNGIDEDFRPAPSKFGELVPATPRELKGMIKDWRGGRATRNILQAMSDAYIALIGALMIGAMAVNAVLKAQNTVASCSSVTCLSARALLPIAAFAAAVAVALAASRLFGPVLASAAEGFWLLDAPISRAKLLQARLVGAIAAAFVGGALIGALIAALTGSDARGIIVWSAATGLSAAASVAFGAAQQGVDRHRLTHAISYLFGLLAVAAMTAVVGVAAGWFSLRLSRDRGTELGLIMIGFASLVLILSAILARVRLARIRRTRLLSGGALVSGLSGAFYALDIGLARDIVVERRALEIGHVKPKRGRGLGLEAIIWRELQRLRRFPQPLIALAGTIVVPYAADALGMSVLTPLVAALALFGALVPLMGGLRVLTRTGGLARCLPFSLARLKLASIAVPAALTALWAAATTPAYAGLGPGGVARNPADLSLTALAVGAIGLLGAVRWTTAKGVDYGVPMVSSGAGAFPPGLFLNLFRGFDICLIGTAPLLLGGSPLWSLAIAAIAAGILLNSMDAESLRQAQAEQRRQLEKQKKAQAMQQQQRKR